MPQLPEKLSASEVSCTKSDYSEIVDSSTDRTAAEINNAFCAASSMTRTATRFYAKVTCDASTIPTITSWDAVWKGATSTAPVPTHPASGRYVLTLPAAVGDELGLGNEHDLNLVVGWANAEGSTFLQCQVEMTNTNVIQIRIFDAAGAATDPVSTAFHVFAI